jgi:hypothetical protein
MTTTEKNAEIALFMGYIDNGCSEDGFLIHPETNYDEDISELEYHNDWSSIMSVVEKIEKILPDDSFVTIEYKDCYIPVLEADNPFTIQANGGTKIESVYEAVFQFIQWYNQNKEPK